MLPARLRNGVKWSDACILNISSRGLMIYAKCFVEPGSYVELRRGGQPIVARVIWRANNRIGLCSHDRLAVEDIVRGEVVAAAVPVFSGSIRVEPRRQPQDVERSRARARAMQFLSLLLIGTALAVAAGAIVADTLSRPAAAVQAAMTPD